MENLGKKIKCCRGSGKNKTWEGVSKIFHSAPLRISNRTARRKLIGEVSWHLYKFIYQDMPDQSPMPINKDQTSGMIQNVDQLLKSDLYWSTLIHIGDWSSLFWFMSTYPWAYAHLPVKSCKVMTVLGTLQLACSLWYLLCISLCGNSMHYVLEAVISFCNSIMRRGLWLPVSKYGKHGGASVFVYPTFLFCLPGESYALLRNRP